MKLINCLSILFPLLFPIAGCAQGIQDDYVQVQRSAQQNNPTSEVLETDDDICLNTHWDLIPVQVITSFHIGSDKAIWHIQTVEMPSVCVRASYQAITIYDQRLIVISDQLENQDNSFVYTATIHELGHALKLMHVLDEHALMYNAPNTSEITTSDISECIRVGSCPVSHDWVDLKLVTPDLVVNDNSLLSNFHAGARQWNMHSKPEMKIVFDQIPRF